MIYYMIRHIATGEFMPELAGGRGYSHWNPGKINTTEVFRPRKLTGTPRLIASRGKAHRCIVLWNSIPNARKSTGMTYYGEEDEGVDIKSDGRKKEDLEIVEVSIEVISGKIVCVCPLCETEHYRK